jgi:predicted DNA-binding protein (MmcQ/YjbR family)
MSLEEIRKYCLSLKGVTESIKWEHHLCFCIGEKMFMITSPDEFPVNASFKTTDELFDKLIAREGFIAAPYLARNKWVKIDDVRRLSAKDWKKFIDTAYDQIFQKLTMKLQKEILEKKKASKKRKL